MKLNGNEYVKAVKDQLTGLGLKVIDKIELYQRGENSIIMPDLVIFGEDGKRLVIEIIDTGVYPVLPLYTAVEMGVVQEANPNSEILLISLSTVTSVLADALQRMGIIVLEKPSVNKAVSFIANSSYGMSA